MGDSRVPEYEELWNTLLPTAQSIADIGQGLVFKTGVAIEGDVPGFVDFSREGVSLHALPSETLLNLADDRIRRRQWGTKTGTPQVLLPYARTGRGPWRLTAHIDRVGHAVTSNFLVVRPKSPSLPLEYLWALFVSPYANAYAYSTLGKRHNIPTVIRNMPVPYPDIVGIERVSHAAWAYLAAAEEGRATGDELRDLLLRVDAQVLRLYALPAKQERTLLRMFDGVKRPGVPFDFNRYYPPDFESAIPLHVYVSDTYRRSTPARLLAAPPAPKELVEALQRATEDLGD